MSAADLEGRLEFSGTVTRGSFTLDASIAVAPGEVVALLGPNGAGKSTLLRTVAGLGQLDGGTVRIAGAVVDAPASRTFVAPEARHLGVVFQDHRLFPHLRVVDNIAFGPRSRGISRTAARRSAAEWLDRLGLQGFARRRPSSLSGGQAQRVALARALASSPQALLLDEPLAALDIQTRAEVQGELRRHLLDFGRPTLLVTHDPIEALLLADRIVVLEAGRVVQSGPTAKVTRQPATAYVARLVGVNLFAGAARDGVVTVDGGGRLLVAGAPAGRVLVAVRPSALTLHRSEPTDSSARNRWRGTITAVASLGDRIRVTVASSNTDSGGPAETHADVTATAVAELGLARGAEVWLSVKATDLESYRGPATELISATT